RGGGVEERRLPSGADLVLARRLRPLPAGGGMERRRPVDSGAAGLRERPPHGRAVGALHVLRPRRAGLVQLRMGDPAARDRLPGDLPLRPARRAPVPAPAAAARDHLAAALADLPDPSGSRPDQPPARPLLPPPPLPLLP